MMNSRIYALVCGGLLFIIGIYGFAFRGSTRIPDLLLVLCLVLGFWGLVLASQKR